MTRNRPHHVLRDRVRSRRVIADAEADDLMATVTDPRPGASEILLADEEKRLLAEASWTAFWELSAVPVPSWPGRATSRNAAGFASTWPPASSRQSPPPREWPSARILWASPSHSCCSTWSFLPCSSAGCRVTARRLAAELTEDPGALERHRRERRMQILAAVLGFLAGGCGLLWGILLSGK